MKPDLNFMAKENNRLLQKRPDLCFCRGYGVGSMKTVVPAHMINKLS